MAADTAVRLAVLAALGLLLPSCSKATEEDRAAISGLWQPEDGTKRTVEFKADGEFNYLYFATLRLKWELGRKGQVLLKGSDGSAFKTCFYKIENSRLLIDNGSGDTCVTPAATPPSPMPISFRRPG
jgi:hypothetical protein